MHVVHEFEESRPCAVAVHFCRILAMATATKIHRPSVRMRCRWLAHKACALAARRYHWMHGTPVNRAQDRLRGRRGPFAHPQPARRGAGVPVDDPRGEHGDACGAGAAHRDERFPDAYRGDIRRLVRARVLRHFIARGTYRRRTPGVFDRLAAFDRDRSARQKRHRAWRRCRQHRRFFPARLLPADLSAHLRPRLARGRDHPWRESAEFQGGAAANGLGGAGRHRAGDRGVRVPALRRAAAPTPGQDRNHGIFALSAFVLLCIGVQIFWDGLAELLEPWKGARR